MGNETSTMNNNQSNNKMMEDLQKQILENQLEIQRIQLNNLQNGQNNQCSQQNQSPLNSILSNPALQQQIAKDPEKKEQLLTKLLTDYNHTLSPQQRNKIQYMLPPLLLHFYNYYLKIVSHSLVDDVTVLFLA